MMVSKAKSVVDCTNCGSPASHTLGDVVAPVQYCPTCLPAHFRQDAADGKYPLALP